MLSRLLLLLIFVSVLAACEFKNDPVKPAETPAPTPAPTVAPFDTETVKVNVLPLPTPGQYALDITWAKVSEPVFLKLKTDDDFTQVEPSKNTHRITFDHGSEYELEFERRDQDGKVLNRTTLNGEIPSDYVVEGTQIVTENRKVTCGRFYLPKGTILQLQNFQLQMNCNELISDSGAIETFPANLVPVQKGVSGRSGASSVLKFKKVKGTIYINLRGESGGDGRNGIRGYETRNGYFKGCRGQDGGSGGNTGSISIFTEEPSSLVRVSSFVPGKGGKPGHSIAAFEDKEAIRPKDSPGYTESFGECIQNGASGNYGDDGAFGKSCLTDYDGQVICHYGFLL